MKHPRPFAALALVLLLTGGPVRGEEKEKGPGPSPPIVSVEAEKTAREARLIVNNRSPGQVTVTLACHDLRNAEAAVPLPHTVTIPGLSRQAAVILRPVEPGRPWHFRFTYKWQHGAPAPAHDDGHIYRLPFTQGHAYRMCQGFQGAFSHKGLNALDWAMPVGCEVRCAREGLVVEVVSRHDKSGPTRAFEAWANYVRVLHRDGSVATYQHLRKHGTRVKAGQKVRAGDLLGYSGNTGYTTEPHLHFHVEKPVDGTRTVTCPIRLRTVRCLKKGESPIAEGRYTQAPVKKRKGKWSAPVGPAYNAVGSVTLCQAIRASKPWKAGRRFSLGQTVVIFVELQVPGAYRVSLRCYPVDQGTRDAAVLEVVTRPGWAHCWQRLTPELVKGRTGLWLAEVFIGRHRMSSTTFEIVKKE